MLSAYQQHKAKWIGCTLCPLSEGRTNVVLVRGTLPCDILFVGEAPGASEDVLGRPFVGPAGKLMDKIIESALGDLIWPGVFDENGDDVPIAYALTNLVACIPIGDDGDKVKEPPKESIDACAPRLREIVEIARPRLIVRVGALATKWTHKATETIRKRPNDPAVQWCDVLHPAYILRLDASQQPLAIKRAVVAISDAASLLSPRD